MGSGPLALDGVAGEDVGPGESGLLLGVYVTVAMMEIWCVALGWEIGLAN